MEKISLPIKTKIAAWWMIVIGATFSAVIFFFAIRYFTGPYLYLEVWILRHLTLLTSLSSALLLFLPGILILKGASKSFKVGLMMLRLGTVIAFSFFVAAGLFLLFFQAGFSLFVLSFVNLIMFSVPRLLIEID